MTTLIPLLGCNHLSEQQDPKPSSTISSINTTNVNYQETPVNNKKINTIQHNDNNKVHLIKKPVKQSKVILDVPLIRQNPELKFGCEVTSLTMLLQYEGVKVSKIDLYKKIKKDPDPVVLDPNGNIIKWGNPAHGFVGDMTGKQKGYAVFDKPMIDLINVYLPSRAVNLTNKPFETLEDHIRKGFPIVIWTTGDYRLPDRWESWMHGNETIKTPLDLHAVVLVGFDEKNVYLNDPLSGRKNVTVNKEQFIQSWNALKNRAVSYQ